MKADAIYDDPVFKDAVAAALVAIQRHPEDERRLMAACILALCVEKAGLDLDEIVELTRGLLEPEDVGVFATGNFQHRETPPKA